MKAQRIDTQFPRRTSERMKQLGMDVTEIASRLGYASHTPVSYHLSATKPRPVSWEKVIEYARILGCTPEWLARGEGPPPAAPAAAPMVIRTYGTEAPPEPRTCGERIRLVRAQSDLNAADFARRLQNQGIKVTRQALYKLENDEVEDPSCKIMVAIEEFTGYRVRWLLTGRGEPKGVSPKSQSELTDLKALGRALEALRDAENVPEVAAMPVEARAAMLAGFYKRLS